MIYVLKDTFLTLSSGDIKWDMRRPVGAGVAVCSGGGLVPVRGGAQLLPKNLLLGDPSISPLFFFRKEDFYNSSEVNHTWLLFRVNVR